MSSHISALRAAGVSEFHVSYLSATVRRAETSLSPKQREALTAGINTLSLVDEAIQTLVHRFHGRSTEEKRSLAAQSTHLVGLTEESLARFVNAVGVMARIVNSSISQKLTTSHSMLTGLRNGVNADEETEDDEAGNRIMAVASKMFNKVSLASLSLGLNLT